MENILDKIIKNKKREIAKRKKEVRIKELFYLIQNQSVPRSFSHALNQDNTVSVIAEIKKSSPSAGMIRADFDPVFIAEEYAENGASAISVLTEERYFAGNINYLNLIRKQVTLPLLRKDFIIDPYQVIEARAYGADAILIILNLLSGEQCNEIVQASHDYNLEYLVEVHSPDELEIALTNGYRFIGINNRNLKSFKVDLKITEILINSIPAGVIVVSESGIKNQNQVKRLGELGVDAVLIGEILMRQPEVGSALKSFVGVPKWSR